jgi:hypothetical protein
MSRYVFFHMMSSFRDSLIEEHLFYVKQAQKRLLSSFANIDDDASKAAEEWLKRAERFFNPERDDPAQFYEQAEEEARKFYGLLSDMREQTRLSVVAGTFHQWDKELRDWLARETGHWHTGQKAAAAIWRADFDQLLDLLESIGWKIRDKAFYQDLDACHLVVNVYKHGQGVSLSRLQEKYPEYVADVFRRALGERPWRTDLWTSHKDLKVQDDQIEAFSRAIVEFWKGAPQRVFDDEIEEFPAWFEKALLVKDPNPRLK